MTFWLITIALALGSCTLLALALWRGHLGARPAAEFDLRVYRDQLSDVERDIERGVIKGDDAERVLTEISRRILTADKALQDESVDVRSPKAARFVAIGGLAAVLIGGSFALYRDLGAPGYGDLSLSTRIEAAADARASRPDQATAEASLPPFVIAPDTPKTYAELIVKLREAVEKRPADLQGATLLATHEMRLGNAVAAHAAQAAVIRLKGAAVSAEDYATYADMLIIAAGGYVSPEAEGALARVLRFDPENGVARYYSGLMMMQVGRPDVAFRAWAQLLQDSGGNEGWVVPIREQIEDLAFRAGVKYELAPSKDTPLTGPSVEDIENAETMSEEERTEMIRGMVDRLSDRLATTGGSAEEWARLIGALGVLGEADQAALIWQNAKDVFADRPDDLAIVRGAARQLGITK
ncbi:c-type cytochrome biogenesis protein CcmI [Planktotalea sp.]|uniref:c-type cytochrome biogenesis protein CcmI n=1 Tax=Planktotalea sp. TaxID=2029877 RepID=UPI0025D18D1E|nr:c-type cytochrome biogenesis protein CcmI [Planktotalea sp.]